VFEQDVSPAAEQRGVEGEWGRGRKRSSGGRSAARRRRVDADLRRILLVVEIVREHCLRGARLLAAVEEEGDEFEEAVQAADSTGDFGGTDRAQGEAEDVREEERGIEVEGDGFVENRAVFVVGLAEERRDPGRRHSLGREQLAGGEGRERGGGRDEEFHHSRIARYHARAQAHVHLKDRCANTRVFKREVGDAVQSVELAA
jgi:hypothetical protein